MPPVEIPNLASIRAVRANLDAFIDRTPVWEWKRPLSTDRLEIFLKLELFQRTGSFKLRGALAVLQSLSPQQLRQGVTAVSGGNHAIAVAYAAKQVGTSVKVVMPQTANAARKKLCLAYGAEVVLEPDMHAAFQRVEAIRREEGRALVHPFEGEKTALGTATVGLEFCEQVDALDAVIVPVGGGGLIAGIGSAFKQLQSPCRVIGVEPEGADTMRRSFAQGKPAGIEKVLTIADSLGAPHAAPYSFALCQKVVDELVSVSDAQILEAMRVLFEEMKLAVEPAGATATAALLGPLKEKLKGKRVGVIVCGANIDAATYCKWLQPD